MKYLLTIVISFVLLSACGGTDAEKKEAKSKAATKTIVKKKPVVKIDVDHTWYMSAEIDVLKTVKAVANDIEKGIDIDKNFSIITQYIEANRLHLVVKNKSNTVNLEVSNGDPTEEDSFSLVAFHDLNELAEIDKQWFKNLGVEKLWFYRLPPYLSSVYREAAQNQNLIDDYENSVKEGEKLGINSVSDFARVWVEQQKTMEEMEKARQQK